MTLLYFPGCPNWQLADANLRAALAEAGADAVVRRRVVDTLEEAERMGFLGSPTVLIDGRDPFAESGALPGLSCRVYRIDAGVAGAPTVAQLRAALAAAPERPGPPPAHDGRPPGRPTGTPRRSSCPRPSPGSRSATSSPPGPSSSTC